MRLFGKGTGLTLTSSFVCGVSLQTYVLLGMTGSGVSHLL